MKKSGKSLVAAVSLGTCIAVTSCTEPTKTEATASASAVSASASQSGNTAGSASAPATPATCNLTLKALDYTEWSPDGSFLLTGGTTVAEAPDDKTIEDGAIDAWDLAKGERAFSFHLGTPKIASGVHVAFAKDGKSAVAAFSQHGSGAHPLARWDFASGKTTFAASRINYPEGIDISPDGTLALADGGGSNLLLVELPSMKVLKEDLNDTAASGFMAFSKDGAGVVSDWQGQAAILDPKTLKPTKEWDAPGVDLSPDAATVAIFSKGFVGTVDASTGKKRSTFEGAPKELGVPIMVVSFSPDGKKVAAVTEKVFVWSSEDGKRSGVAEVPAGPLAWTKDSTVLLVGDQPIDAATMKVLAPLKGGLAAKLAGHLVLVAEAEKLIEVDAATAKPTGRSWSYVSDDGGGGVAVTRDGAYFAYAQTGDKVVRVVRASDGATLQLAVAMVGKEQKGFAVSTDGSFDGPPEAAGCAAKLAGAPAKLTSGVITAFFKR